VKIKVTAEAILDTDKITNTVKAIIERSAFNQTPDNLANMWALSEVQTSDKKITLELL